MVFAIRSRGKLVLVVLMLVAVSLPLRAESVDEMLKGEQLKKAYNPVLLDYLLNEGKSALPEARRKAAIDQLVTALKQDIVITPEMQKAASAAVAAAGLAQLFGGSNSRELGGVADDATHQIWSGWIDSAVTLQRAGYTADAVAFYQKCLDIYPYPDLKGRCGIAMAGAKPQEAVDRLLKLTKDGDESVTGPAILALGDLAGTGSLPAEEKARVVKRIIEFTSGLQKATFGKYACPALVAAKDPAAVPVLQGMSKGMMNAELYACSRRGLLTVYNDRSVIPLLEGTLKGGMMDTSKPSDKLFAARLLVESGEDSGYTWAAQQLMAKKQSGMKKFMSMGDDKAPDLKPSTVSILVDGKKDKSLAVLKPAFDAAEAGSWLQTWIAIAMLQLGDTSHADMVRKAMDVPDWDFTAVRAAEALSKSGDATAMTALGPVYTRALKSDDAKPAVELLALISGNGGQYQSDREARAARQVNLRIQIADALGDSNRKEAVPLLQSMLEDPNASVRTAAARALCSMSTAAAAPALAKAIDVDYGKSGDLSRNPTMHAAIVRRAGTKFAGDAATRTVIATGAKSQYASVRFLAAAVGAPKGK